MTTQVASSSSPIHHPFQDQAKGQSVKKKIFFKKDKLSLSRLLFKSNSTIERNSIFNQIHLSSKSVLEEKKQQEKKRQLFLGIRSYLAEATACSFWLAPSSSCSRSLTANSYVCLKMTTHHSKITKSPIKSFHGFNVGSISW